MVGTIIWRATGNQQVIEDLAQETFLRVFKGLAYFDRRSKLSTWIYTIAHRVAVDHLRQASRWREVLHENAAEALSLAPALDASPEAMVAQDQMDLLVRQELAILPDKYRLPLVYAAINGLDHQTIGAALGVQPSTVKTLVFRGRQMLKGRILAALRQRYVI